jgi:hypothetical protein
VLLLTKCMILLTTGRGALRSGLALDAADRRARRRPLDVLLAEVEGGVQPPVLLVRLTRLGGAVLQVLVRPVRVDDRHGLALAGALPFASRGRCCGHILEHAGALVRTFKVRRQQTRARLDLLRSRDLDGRAVDDFRLVDLEQVLREVRAAAADEDVRRGMAEVAELAAGVEPATVLRLVRVVRRVADAPSVGLGFVSTGCQGTLMPFLRGCDSQCNSYEAEVVGHTLAHARRPDLLAHHAPDLVRERLGQDRASGDSGLTQREARYCAQSTRWSFFFFGASRGSRPFARCAGVMSSQR